MHKKATRAKKPPQYYVVLGIVVCFVFDSYEEASEKARATAEENPGCPYFVVQAIESVCYSRSPYVIVNYEEAT